MTKVEEGRSSTEKVENLKKQQEAYRIGYEKCSGAIEILEVLIKEKEENKSGHKKTNS